MQLFVEEPLDDYLKCGSVDDLGILYWIEKHRERLPKLRFDCGIKDSLIEGNRALHQALLDQGIPHNYEEFTGGHDWPYWRQHVSKTLRFASGLEGTK